MIRKEGYYWVKNEGEWMVCFYEHPCIVYSLPHWYMPIGWEYPVYDDEFEVINENRLLPPLDT